MLSVHAPPPSRSVGAQLPTSSPGKHPFLKKKTKTASAMYSHPNHSGYQYTYTGHQTEAAPQTDAHANASPGEEVGEVGVGDGSAEVPQSTFEEVKAQQEAHLSPTASSVASSVTDSDSEEAVEEAKARARMGEGED